MGAFFGSVFHQISASLSSLFWVQAQRSFTEMIILRYYSRVKFPHSTHLPFDLTKRSDCPHTLLHNIKWLYQSLRQPRLIYTASDLSHDLKCKVFPWETGGRQQEPSQYSRPDEFSSRLVGPPGLGMPQSQVACSAFPLSAKFVETRAKVNNAIWHIISTKHTRVCRYKGGGL